MMIIRLMHGDGQTDYDCQHVTRRFFSDRVELELSRKGEPPIRLQLPRDGEVAYQMNDAGETVKGGVIRPPDSRKEKAS